MVGKQTLEQTKEEEFQRKIFIGGLSRHVTEAELENYFSKFGAIDDILINRSSKTNACKGCAFVLFKEQTVAEYLIQSKIKHEVGSKVVEVKSCHKKGTKSKHYKSTQGSNCVKKDEYSSQTTLSYQLQNLKGCMSTSAKSPYTQSWSLSTQLSPMEAFESPILQANFSPLEELEDDFCLEENVSNKRKVSMSLNELPDQKKNISDIFLASNKSNKVQQVSWDKLRVPAIDFDNKNMKSNVKFILKKSEKIALNHFSNNLVMTKNSSFNYDQLIAVVQDKKTISQFDFETQTSKNIPFASFFENNRYQNLPQMQNGIDGVLNTFCNLKSTKSYY